jgi:hypothetical protein
MVLFAAACAEECVDQFDCTKIPSKNPLVCEDGRCVVRTSLPAFPNFGPLPMDAGPPDAGRSDAGPQPDSGAESVPIRSTALSGRFSGGQMVPPLVTAGSGMVTAALEVEDGGTFRLTYALSVSNLESQALTLMFGATAGRNGNDVLSLSDAGLSGALPLSRMRAEAVVRFRSALIVTGASQGSPSVRAQLVPRGAFTGFTQFARALDGQYGGGGHIILASPDGGMIPTLGTFDFDWRESGRVASASVNQGPGSSLIDLPLNSTRTGSSGEFSPLALVLMLRDAGIFVTGTGFDGGEVFRGDLSLSLR